MATSRQGQGCRRLKRDDLLKSFVRAVLQLKSIILVQSANKQLTTLSIYTHTLKYTKEATLTSQIDQNGFVYITPLALKRKRLQLNLLKHAIKGRQRLFQVFCALSFVIKTKVPDQASSKPHSPKQLQHVMDDCLHGRSIYLQVNDEWMLYLRQYVLLVLYMFNLFQSDHFSNIHYLKRMILRGSPIAAQKYPAKSSCAYRRKIKQKAYHCANSSVMRTDYNKQKPYRRISCKQHIKSQIAVLRSKLPATAYLKQLTSQSREESFACLSSLKLYCSP